MNLTFTSTTKTPTQQSKMSFSNADTGSKPADPYKAKNLDEPSLKEKVEDLSTFMDACKFGMMTTRDGKTGALVSRCMALAAKSSKEEGMIFNICQQEHGGTTLLFHTNTESGKTDELETDSHINISFLNGSGEWASISGFAKVETDRETVRKYYSPSLKAWIGDLGDGTHDGGPEDPRIGVIKVDARTATYAISRVSILGRAKEMAQGVITGEAPKVNKLREISEEEINTWRTSQGMVQ
ncbi:bli-3 protein [Rutstroemia sp. NJR-2017a BVV2]|nr:bli-3 protein [Rutstroemia sp. NJR-2017a BVV2]